MMKAGLLLPLIPWLLALGAPAQSSAEAEAEERVFIVKEYRYDPGPNPGTPSDADFGLSLCATRCNALSVDYLNYMEPGGWRMIQVAIDRELNVDLNNPLMAGRCICVADEYVVKADDLNNPITWQDPTRSGDTLNRQPLSSKPGNEEAK